MAGHHGKLELTWTNKGQRLLAREDGGYEWVPPHDHRVREVRLLQEAGSVGELGARRARDNLLVRGDSLNALMSLVELPEFREELVGRVKLVYIDPPFNTGQAFAQYDDGLEHSVWLTMMRDRLTLLKQLLAPEGSIWVHLDDAEMAYCRVLMDEAFGREKFVATVVWQKRTSRDNRAAFSSMHDYLLVYSPGGTDWKDVRSRLPDSGDYANPDGDPRGPWRSVPMSAQEGHATHSQFYELETPTGQRHLPPRGRAWTYTKPRFTQLVAEGRVYWPRGGDGRPRLKRYPDESEGLVPFTIWPSDEVGTNDDAKKQVLTMFPHHDAFATPKPERLLQRIIHIATHPGDLVLDCFAGSGTTAAVAHKMGRRWVTIEAERATLETFTAPRLEKVVAGADPGGVSEDTGWSGGGGFRVLDVAPSIFEEDAGTVILADWATNSVLAEATAAQLGFEYAPEGSFAGRRGRTRLAVLDGHITKGLVEVLLSALAPKERLSLVGVGVDPAASELLEHRRPGSRARTVPRDILLAYQSPSPWRLAVVSSPPAEEDARSGSERAPGATADGSEQPLPAEDRQETAAVALPGEEAK